MKLVCCVDVVDVWCALGVGGSVMSAAGYSHARRATATGSGSGGGSSGGSGTGSGGGGGGGGDHQLLEKFAAGGLACMLMSAVLNPMDVVKVRLQLQNQLQSLDRGSQPYRGLSHAALKIAKEEGIARGLWKGITPSMLREASYSSMRIGLYDYFKGVVAPTGTGKEEFALWQKFVAGCASGMIGSSIATPTDLVKV